MTETTTDTAERLRQQLNAEYVDACEELDSLVNAARHIRPPGAPSTQSGGSATDNEYMLVLLVAIIIAFIMGALVNSLMGFV